MQKFFLNVLILILIFKFDFTQSIIPINRNLSIFFELGNNENINVVSYVPNSIGIITGEFLVALYQEAGPILVTEGLLKNILQRKTMFNDFAQIVEPEKIIEKYKLLQAKYGFIEQFKKTGTQEFANQIETFSQECVTVKNLYNLIETDLNSNLNKENILHNVDGFIKLNQSLISRFNILYLMCDKIQFDRFIIKVLSVPKQPNFKMYLFIPKTYLSNLGITNYNELNLGIKINKRILDPNLDELSIISPKIEKLSLSQKQNYQDAFLEILSEMFIANIDHQWAFFMSGHGYYKSKYQEEAQRQSAIDRAKKELMDAQQKIEELKIQKDKDKEIKNLEEEIKDLEEDLQAYENGKKNFYKNRLEESQIAGLKGTKFQSFLKLLNKDVNTSFLFYESCYAGGQLFIDPYKELTTGEYIPLKYTIVSSSINEAPTAGYPIFNNFLPGSEQNVPDDLIDITNKKINFFKTSLNYNEFFKELGKVENLASYKQLFSYVSYPNFLSNLPSIRFPNTNWFNLINLNKEIIELTKVKILTQDRKPLIIDQSKQKIKAILFYDSNIIFPIKIIIKEKDYLPAFISMIPESAYHVIDQMEISGSSLIKLIEAFFSIGELEPPKLFLIKELKIIFFSHETIYKDIVFVNNWINYLGETTDKDKDKYVNYVIYTDAFNKIQAVKWPGSTMFESWHKFKEIGKFRKYKEILLDDFSQAKIGALPGRFSGILNTVEGEGTAKEEVIPGKGKVVKEKIEPGITGKEEITSFQNIEEVLKAKKEKIHQLKMIDDLIRLSRNLQSLNYHFINLMNS